jgi:hypothetical protein
MTGEVVHQWHLPFRQAWSDIQHVENPVEEGRIHWHTVKMFPNGDLLVNYVAIAAKPYGYGLVKMDKDSRVIWRYSDNAHHSFDVGPNGKIYALRHAYEDRRHEFAKQLRTPMLEDSVVILSESGTELRRIDVLSAFANSKFKNYLSSFESDKLGDHTHCNAIDVISPAFAEKNGFCTTGDVMLSLRNPSLLAILNLQRQEIVWAARGVWERQHDSDPLENGNIMLFDNQGNRGEGGTSRILEWNPASGAIEWCFQGNRNDRFESKVRGGQQLLPNGNVLIAESNNGRLIEVTREGEIAWEYYNPDRPGKNHDLVAVICSALRYNRGALTFLDPPPLAQIDNREPQ